MKIISIDDNYVLNINLISLLHRQDKITKKCRKIDNDLLKTLIIIIND